jgi:hypothetical protein
MFPVKFNFLRYYVIGYEKSKENEDISAVPSLKSMEQVAVESSHVMVPTQQLTKPAGSHHLRQFLTMA